jgi:hypothetical protein
MKNVYTVMNLLLSSSICFNNAKHVSFTANGRWGPIPDNETETSLQQELAAKIAGSTVRAIISNESICNRYMCSPSNLTFLPDYANTLFDMKSGCKALIDKNISTILFYGDSFMRQIYAGMLITLNGDYEGGSLANLTLTPQCAGMSQFNEKSCGTRSLNHEGRVCDGKVHLDPILSGLGELTTVSHPGSVALWSVGNYKTTRSGRHGVNNATAYQELFETDICQKLNARNSSRNTTANRQDGEIYWISTHFRVRAIFGDETDEIIRDYNLNMRKYFDEGLRCGDVNYIDVYNVTANLVLNHREQAVKMTYDQVHWGYQLNLWKAQIILNAITS